MKRSLIAMTALAALCSCGGSKDGPEAAPTAKTAQARPSGYRPVRADYEAVMENMLTNAAVPSASVEAYAREHGLPVDGGRLARKRMRERGLAGRPRPVGGAEFLQDEVDVGNGSAQR